MIVFSFSDYKYLSDKICKGNNCKKGNFAALRYPNGEIHITLKTDVKGKQCAILGSIVPPDSNLVSFLLLADTLKKEGAKKVVAVLPYLAYARHDKIVPQESLATGWIGKIIKQSGIDKIISFDVHSKKDQKLIPVPIKSLSASELFANTIIKNKLSNATFVAPDNGAIKWCEAVKHAAKMKGDISHFEKHRTKNGIAISKLIGKITPEIIIVDDMIDTGQTLLLACEKLKKAGAKKITVMVTHGIFSGQLWRKLWQLGVDHIYCTDSLSFDHIPQDNRITVLPIENLLKSEISKI